LELTRKVIDRRNGKALEEGWAQEVLKRRKRMIKKKL